MAASRKIGEAATALLAALADGPLTRADAKARLGLDWRQMTNAARGLAGRGYLVFQDNGFLGLTRDGQQAAASGLPIRGRGNTRVKIVHDTLRERAWAAMRVRKAFTVGDIVADAQRGDEMRPRDNITRYIARLKAAGFVQEEARRQPGTAIGSNGFKRFRLVRNAGPKAPVFREATTSVFDPNTGLDIPCARR